MSTFSRSFMTCFSLIFQSHHRRGLDIFQECNIIYTENVMRNKSLYPKNWTAISRAYRKKMGNRCEDCGRLGTRFNPNHTDHIDGNKMNCQDDNLKVLCPACHFLKGLKSGEINPDHIDRLKRARFQRRKICLLLRMETRTPMAQSVAP